MNARALSIVMRCIVCRERDVEWNGRRRRCGRLSWRLLGRFVAIREVRFKCAATLLTDGGTRLRRSAGAILRRDFLWAVRMHCGHSKTIGRRMDVREESGGAEIGEAGSESLSGCGIYGHSEMRIGTSRSWAWFQKRENKLVKVEW